MADVYEGGIPNQGFDGTFPKSEDQGEMFQPDPTKGEIDTEAGEPASFHGSSNQGDFIGKDSYDGPGDMEPGAMKVVDLDDIKTTV